MHLYLKLYSSVSTLLLLVYYVHEQGKTKDGAYGRTEVAMKFRPDLELLRRPAMAEYIHDDGFEIRVPLSLTSPDQVLPVNFTLIARLTPGELVVEPSSLLFGTCFTTQVRSQRRQM